jgi:nucleoside-diphosphate-sugar epimerase
LNILITGATGFIGQAVVQHLLAMTDHQVTALTRRTSAAVPDGVKCLQVEAIDGSTDYGNQLAGVDVVIHLAARVHRLNETSGTSYPAYKSINVDGTLNLARQAVKAGVRRFIYLSSIKVNGESTQLGKPFTADDTPTPSDPYAISKCEAERGLMALSKDTGMQYVIIRPPLVYGPGVKANFQKLMGLIRKGLPLPLGSTDNLRSMVSIDNLVNLVQRCINHPNANNKVFLVSDDRDVSTTELLRIVADAMDLPCRLILFPKSLLTLAASIFGKKDIARRLLGSLQVDISKTKSELDWKPVITIEEAIRLTVRSYIQHTR